MSRGTKCSILKANGSFSGSIVPKRFRLQALESPPKLNCLNSHLPQVFDRFYVLYFVGNGCSLGVEILPAMCLLAPAVFHKKCA